MSVCVLLTALPCGRHHCTPYACIALSRRDKVSRHSLAGHACGAAATARNSSAVVSIKASAGKTQKSRIV